MRERIIVTSDDEIWSIGSDTSSFVSGVYQHEFTTKSSVSGGNFILKFQKDQNSGTTTAGRFTIESISIKPSSFEVSDGDSYIASVDREDGDIRIYSYAKDSWGSPGIDLGSRAASNDANFINPITYNVDGNLRFGDGNHLNGTSTVNKWYGYIVRNRFKYDGGTYNGEYKHHSWWLTDQEIKAPTTGTVETSATYTAGTINMRFTFGGSGGSWTNAAHEFARTDIYDNSQESPLYVYASTVTPSANNSLENIYAYGMFSLADGTLSLDNRITGSNIYYRIKDGEDSTWYFLCYIDFYYGISYTPEISTAESQYKNWSKNAGDDKKYTCHATTDIDDPPDTFDYQSLSGLNQEINSLYAKYSTAVVVNRRAYIANLTYKGKDGSTIIRNDAMIKTPVNQFDTFNADNLIEATIEDGDEIVKLEDFADRILQFKKQKLHIINISQEIEFLEETIMFQGIMHPASCTKTPMGIAWANSSGVYLYDGQKIHDLFVRNGQKVISDSDWSNHYTERNAVGYDSSGKLLLISKDFNGGSNSGDVYIYDMVLKAWTFGDSLINDTGEHSDFFIGKDNLLYFSQEDTNTADFAFWSNTPTASASTEIITKDWDFGAPSVRKKIYKVYVTYKGSMSSVTCQYDTNGLGTYSNFYRTIAGTGLSDKTNSDSTPFQNEGTDDWVRAELIPVSSVNNVYSFRLQFGGVTGSNVEINDISIIYRMKSIK